MWEELEKEIKLYDEMDILRLKTEPIFGCGNRKAKYIILFDQVTDSMNETRSIENSEQFNKLKIILQYVGISMNDCYFTLLNKYYNKENRIENKDRKYAMPIFLKEIYLVNPKAIITIGEDVFNYLFNYYTRKEERVDILKNVGKIFDFYGKKLVPIYDMEYIGKLTKKEKKDLVMILREINK